MRVWIDLSNSPHPLLFAPVARHLEQLGHEVGITARDNAQTVELTLERWPHAAIIGGPSPRSRSKKVETMLARIPQLRRWAEHFRADVALSHNSYAQIVVARLLGLRIVTAMDYEGQPANHLAFRLADVVLMPEALRVSSARRQGASDRRARFYDGFKEELYLGDFEPDHGVLDSLGLGLDHRPLAVLRTPPTRATYHRFGNQLFGEVIGALGEDGNARVVVLARHPEQRSAIDALGLSNVVVPDKAIDSRSLMHNADLVIGAGGTMTREAALIGVPTYSAFAGDQPAVDRELETRGLLRRLRRADEILPVTRRSVEPRSLGELRARATGLVTTFADASLSAAPRVRSGGPALLRRS